MKKICIKLRLWVITIQALKALFSVAIVVFLVLPIIFSLDKSPMLQEKLMSYDALPDGYYRCESVKGILGGESRDFMVDDYQVVKFVPCKVSYSMGGSIYDVEPVCGKVLTVMVRRDQVEKEIWSSMTKHKFLRVNTLKGRKGIYTTLYFPSKLVRSN